MISRLFKLVGMMNRAYDRDSRKLFKRIRKYLDTSMDGQINEERELIDQIDLLLSDREPPFEMDDKP